MGGTSSIANTREIIPKVDCFLWYSDRVCGPTKAEHRLSGLIRGTSLFLDHLWSIEIESKFILRKLIRFLNLIILSQIYIYSFLSFLYFFSKKEEQSMRCYHTTYTRIHSTYLHLLLVINDLNTRSVPCFANRSVYTIGVSIKRRPNA